MAECPWNGCNRIRGIEFPNLAKVLIGFYTGDGSLNRKLLIGFELSFILINTRTSSMYVYIKDLGMSMWECGMISNGLFYNNSIKFVDNRFEINNGDAVLNVVDRLYSIIAIGE